MGVRWWLVKGQRAILVRSRDCLLLGDRSGDLQHVSPDWTGEGEQQAQIIVLSGSPRRGLVDVLRLQPSASRLYGVFDEEGSTRMVVSTGYTDAQGGRFGPFRQLEADEPQPVLNERYVPKRP